MILFGALIVALAACTVILTPPDAGKTASTGSSAGQPAAGANANVVKTGEANIIKTGEANVIKTGEAGVLAAGGSGVISGTVRVLAGEASFVAAAAGDRVASHARVYVEGSEIATRADAQGRFTLTGVPEDRALQVVAEIANARGDLFKRRQADVKASKAGADVGDLVVQRGGGVLGKVQLAGGASPLGADVVVAGTTHVAKAGDDGTFLLVNLAEGTYQLRVSFPGHQVAAKEVAVTAGKVATLDASLILATGTGGVILQGTVTAGGQPLAGAYVAVAGTRTATLTDTNGAYRLEAPAATTATVQAFHPAMTLRSEAVALPASGGKQVDLSLTPLGVQAGALAVEVLDEANGQPIPAAKVLVEPGVRELTADAQGKAQAGDLKPDFTYAVRIQKSGYVEGLRFVALNPGGTPTLQVKLKAGGGSGGVVYHDQVLTINAQTVNVNNVTITHSRVDCLVFAPGATCHK